MPHYKAHGLTTLAQRGNSVLQRLLLRVGPYVSTLVGLSTVAMLWVGAVYFSQTERTQTERAAINNAENLARAFEEQIIRSIRAADQTLLYVRDSYARDPQQFDISLWTRNSQFLADFNFQVVVIGKDGRMIASNIRGAQPGLDLSDREHFKVHVGTEHDDLFISKPIFGRVSNKWSIQLTRRINMPDGSFGGVVVVSLDPDYLSKFYESIDVGQQGAVTLVGTDGIVRARASKGAAAIGESIAGGPLFHAYARATSGVYSGKSLLDGIQRLTFFRAVGSYPLIVTVSLAENEVFAIYEANHNRYIAIAALLTLLLVCATAVMAFYQYALASSRDAAEAGTRTRSEFLAMMSHEIRTPMNGVIGMAEVLLESGLTREQRPLVKTLRESAEYLLQIINDVLDFSKLEAGRVEIEEIPFDLPDVVRGTVGLLAAQAEEKCLALPVTIAPDVPRFVRGDPARLRQLLLNLVGNGLKFTKKGQVGVTVGTEVEHALGRIRVTFTVTDTGIGIPEDGLALLFREFSQLDSTIARRFGGTGLGLAICKRVVDLLGGTITVESKVGVGTTFRFTIDFLPASAVEPSSLVLTPQVAAPPLAPGAQLAIPRAPLKILLVEDNKTNRLVATKLLEQLGYKADIANNGFEAVAACKRNAYDLVFMDVMMPEMDGLAATQKIRELPAPFSTPHIVALTANAHPQDREMCLNAGMDDFLSKPVTRQPLAAKLAGFAGALAPQPAQDTPAAEAPASEQFDEAIFAELADTLGPEDTAMIVDSFVTETERQIGIMRAAAKNSDNSAVKREAHAIKSSAGSLGFMHLSRLAQSIEHEALGLNWPALDARLAALASAFAEVRDLTIQRSLYKPATSGQISGAVHVE